MLGLNQSGGNSSSSPTQVGTNTTWGTSKRKMTVCAQCMGAIKTDGTLWTWGRNNKGVLGHNSGSANVRLSSPTQVGTDTNWNYISATYRSFFATKTDNTLWCWGDNDKGALGLNSEGGAANIRSSPTQIPGNWRSPMQTAGYNSAAIKTDGTLWVWGDNLRGELGLNTPSDTGRVSSPTQLPGTDWIVVTGGGRSMIGFQTAV